MVGNPPISIRVDPANPGQFFACCGLLELADRLWRGAEGWFGDSSFHIRRVNVADNTATLNALLRQIAAAELKQLDDGDPYASPIHFAKPFCMTLDWWKDKAAGGGRLKVWAGRMQSVRIAKAMQAAIGGPECQTDEVFDFASVVHDPADSRKKVEPYYFDSRRGANAKSLDIGFAPDSLSMTTAAYPAVEFLCLVGLQRCRPMPTAKSHLFEYYTWTVPCSPEILPAAVCGLLGDPGSQGYRFEVGYRTDQRKHKSFLPSTPIEGGVR